jgi:hypothetical protein
MRAFLETVVLLSTVPLLLPLWAWALDRASRGSIGPRPDPAPRMLWVNPRIPRIRSEQAD